MKKQLIILVSFLFIQLSFSQSSKLYHTMLKGMYKNTVEQISPQDLKAKLDASETITILDTRKIKEYNTSHIAGARFVDYDTFSVDKVTDLGKNELVVVYCSVGYRSERVGEKLRKAGFKNVLNLYGGIFEWVNLGYDVIDNKTDKTSKVHAYDKEWGKWLKKGDKVYE
ncbi:MAG: hypothetical protein AUK44_00965 [Porphyromonadaceae bacterium CG2_30_38_12]|nr:MAG: hypothetical protein AUK44_00965 [Porphyromonadaceae bacterium CG2_30_38_12]